MAADRGGADDALRITVYCGSSRRSGEIFLQLARSLGSEIARRGHVLVYGGTRTGLMGALADAALAGGGRVEGVILRDFVERGIHHPGLHELRTVPDMRLRKAGLEQNADAFVALPGGLGSLEELAEILSFRKLGLHARPLVLLSPRDFYAGLVQQIERGVSENFDDARVGDYFSVTDDPVRAVDLCEAAAS